VASLSLVRATAKRRELATRLALGASRASLARHLLIEGAIIAAAAAGAGILLSQLLVNTTSVFESIVSTHAVDLSIDRRVLYVAIAITGLSAVLVSLLPALQATHTDIGALMKDGAGGAVRRRSLGQRSLVVFQVAASLVLLSSALVIDRAFQRVLEVNPGFVARGLSFDYLEERSIGYDSTRQRALYRQLYDEGRTAPEFAAVALSSTIPPQEYSTRVSVFHPGDEPPPGMLDGHEFELGTRVSVDAVSPNLFDVMRVPIVAGRAFTMSDDRRSEPVVIVSQTLAAKFWPNANPLGQYLSWPPLRGPGRAPMRVVGVASDTRHQSLTAPPPLVMYVPFTQHPELTPAVIVRGRNDVAPTAAQMHAFLSRVDPRVPTYGASRLVDHLESEARPQRLASRWIGAFGVIALVLAGIGLYGVLAQGVLQRTRELAVRAALGATPSSIAGLVVADGLVLAIVGVCVGALASVWAGRGLRSVYNGVAFDAPATVMALGVMALATLAATWLPARRAARLNPVDALRSD
jgi:predicted permease